ncbi:MAG TPA: hypothetical protein VFG76_09505 [Candidatus Polarisedimenticolia bacterium]|nr:hypothetical protein [Candidatus Polarisedimenticolia bacterium]
MPRVQIGQLIELHYLSPNEMVTDLSPVLEGAPLFLQTSTNIEGGAKRELVLHVPWLGRQIRLSATVLVTAAADKPPGLHVRLADGEGAGAGTLVSLGELVGRIKSGAILEEADGSGPAELRIRGLSSTLRAMLALKANPEERRVLAREADPKVIESLLKNPNLSMEEVRRLATRLTLHQGHFTIIAHNSTWMADEMVRMALARNPRLPEFMAETVLQPLSSAVLKTLAESMNATASTKRVASRILQTRGIVLAKGKIAR